MRLDHAAGLPLLFVALASGGLSASGADSDAAKVLKESGLTKAGSVYVIEAEKPVLAKLKAAKAMLAEHAALAERKYNEEQTATRLTELEDQRLELQTNLTEMNQKILEQAATQASNQPRPGPGGMNNGGFNQGGMNWNGNNQGGPTSQLTAQRDQIKQMLAEVTLESKNLKGEATPVKDRGASDEEAKKKEEAVKKTLVDLRAEVDSVTKKYAELGADSSIKKALAELSRAAKANIKLGPSEAFLAAAKTLDQAERRILGKQTPASARKKKGKSRR